MKRKLLQFLLAGAVVGLLTTGCARTYRGAVVTDPVYSTSRVVVHEAPPAPRVERYGVAPSSSHVWVSGYWTQTNNRWVWIPGHWEERPTTSAVWVPGHWDRNPDGRGWIWTPGHWK